MSTSFVKSNIPAGTAGTAALFNHAETQADCIETDLAAGSLPILATALTGTIAAARLPSRNATIFLSAAGGKPRASNGCAPPAWTELATNKIMVPSLDFDKDSDEFAQWMFVMPEGYTGGNVYVKVYWTAASGSGTVIWVVNMRTFDNDDAMDAAFSGYVSPNDALITANDVHITSSTTLTPDGTPAGGELAIVQISRDADNASDTLSVDAKLLGIKIEFPTAYGD